ncbi:histidine-containing phosphotransfer protein 1-like [Salvia hispanica]|uniref:histidine-containing phosphotransfer protein 1-like n=1 Tax=Salvia hispanica TaxID=49212 RepID=UPI002009AD8C|nr:histidine-containing phosphotransfer protein 1-like [Salvia hispanica]
MEVQLQRSYIESIEALFREGVLDAQFEQLLMLRDESNPDIVMEVVTLFSEDCQRILNQLSQTLNEQSVDFKKVDASVHQLKGSTSSIGAARLKNACIAFLSFCDAQNVEGCLRCSQQIEHEYLLLKNNLEALLRLEQQIVAAGGVVPVLNEF